MMKHALLTLRILGALFLGFLAGANYQSKRADNHEALASKAYDDAAAATTPEELAAEKVITPGLNTSVQVFVRERWVAVPKPQRICLEERIHYTYYPAGDREPSDIIRHYGCASSTAASAVKQCAALRQYAARPTGFGYLETEYTPRDIAALKVCAPIEGISMEPIESPTPRSTEQPK